MWIFLITALVLFYVLNHTTIFHSKIRGNVLTKKYACTEDLWFTKESHNKLIIFLHGMYSTPSTFEDLAPSLMEQGWDVYMPSLPASALTREELQTIGPWAWEESLLVIRHKISNLPRSYQKVVLGGHSQGGSLALKIATEKDFDALIIIASPINLYGKHLKLWENIAIFLSGISSFILPKGLWIPIKHQKERAQIEKKCDAEGIRYPYTVFTFQRGLDQLRPKLSKISMPLFLAYCQGDTLVDLNNLEKIKESVSSSVIVEKKYEVSYDIDPYGFRHQLLNYTYTKEALTKALLSFLKSLA